MDATTIATIMVIVLLLAIFIRMPIALAMGAVGAVGYSVLASPYALMAYFNTAWVDKFMSYELAIVPLFILMGHLATRTGISGAIFQASNAWIGHFRGGLAMAAVAGCAMFGSISGSSLATASTMAKVALPEMRKHGYSGALSSGSLAAGGTLGILIPPSVVLIIYALLTEQNLTSIMARVHAEIGITILPEMAARAANATGLIFRPLADSLAKRQIHMLRKREAALSPAARLVEQHILACTADMIQGPTA